MKKSRVHRGRVLAVAVETTGLIKEKVAAKAGYSRSGYYRHIKNADLNFYILMAYGKAIKHDFSEELPDMPKYIVEDSEESYAKPLTLEEAIRKLDQLKDKYLDLIEKYNRLIEEKIEKKK